MGLVKTQSSHASDESRGGTRQIVASRDAAESDVLRGKQSLNTIHEASTGSKYKGYMRLACLVALYRVLVLVRCMGSCASSIRESLNP